MVEIQEVSATSLIQRVWRGHMGRRASRQESRMLNHADLIARNAEAAERSFWTLFRAHLAETASKKLDSEENHAALLIQRMCVRRSLYRAMERYRVLTVQASEIIRHRAASRIVAHAKGWLTRRMFKKRRLKSELSALESEELKAAAVLTHAWLSYSARRQLEIARVQKLGEVRR